MTSAGLGLWQEKVREKGHKTSCSSMW